MGGVGLEWSNANQDEESVVFDERRVEGKEGLEGWSSGRRKRRGLEHSALETFRNGHFRESLGTAGTGLSARRHHAPRLHRPQPSLDIAVNR